MAVLNRDDYFAALHARIGEDASDDAIKFLEDMSDTYADLERKAKGDGEDWERRYRELDDAWKRRYRHRFFNSGDTLVLDADEEVNRRENEETIRIDDLFEERKEN